MALWGSGVRISSAPPGFVRSAANERSLPRRSPQGEAGLKAHAQGALRTTPGQAMSFHYVYLLSSRQGGTHHDTGFTADLKARLAKHNRGEVPPRGDAQGQVEGTRSADLPTAGPPASLPARGTGRPEGGAPPQPPRTSGCAATRSDSCGCLDPCRFSKTIWRSAREQLGPRPGRRCCGAMALTLPRPLCQAADHTTRT